MLPTGHIAAGYLTGFALLKLFHPAISLADQSQLLAWATFFGFAPDVDVFYFFFKHKTLLVANKESAEEPHRNFFTHTPLWWLITGLLIYFLASSLFWKYFGLLLWLGSWSHFLLDSIEDGVQWLSPFSKSYFALRNPIGKTRSKTVVSERKFFKHSFNFLNLYRTKPTFYIEVVIIVTALIIYFK